MTMLRPYINEHFSGTIWRLEIDEISETIFAEVRNDAEKLVNFSAIELHSGNVNFKEMTTPERWLTGMEAAYDGVLLLHNYQSANGPVHRGLTAIDALNGLVLWTNYVFAFEQLTANGPVFYDAHIHPKKLLLADIKTGETTRIYEPTIYPEIKRNIFAPQFAAADALPAEALIYPVFGNSVHYLEYNNFRIVSLHTLQAGVLKQYLYVMDGIDKVYEDLLNTDIQKLQPEAFILHKNRLIYIKNKSELKVLNL